MFIVLLLALVLLAGCWSSLELERRALVAAMGVDRGRDGKMLVTAQIISPERAVRRPGAARAAAGGEEPAVLVVSAEARTLAEAVRLIAKDTGRTLFFPHLAVMVVGEDLAREGLQPVVDWVPRNRELRMATWFAVAPGSARAVVANTAESLERIPGFHIGQLMDRGVQDDSRVVSIHLFDFLQALIRPGMEPVAVRLSVEESGGQEQVQATGAAVFRGYRMAGWLTEIESRGYLWFRGEVRRGILSVPLSEGKYIAFQIRGYRSSLTSEIRESGPVIKLKIDIKGAVDEVHDPTLSFDRPETIDALEPLMAKQIEWEAGAALAKARELGADIFGFGEVIRREHREVWAELRDDWESRFPEVPVEIEVKATLRRTEQIGRPLVPGPG